MKPTNRTWTEICEATQQDFFKFNGYLPNDKEAIILTEEARKEIRIEKENKKQ